MSPQRITRLSVRLVAAVGLLVWASPGIAAPLRQGDIGPRGAGLRLSASGTSERGTTPAGLHTCAVIADGSVRCWGNNSFGQLGDGSTTPSSVPINVTRPGGGLLTSVLSVAAGERHTCAARVDGTVFCWGDNSFFQLGSTAVSTRRAVQAAFTGAVMVTAGAQHTCALRFDGTVHCWGENPQGQSGPIVFDSATPVQVRTAEGTDLTGAVTVAAGARHTCALRFDGTVHCWGLNTDGQLGIGITGRQDTAVKVTVAGGGDFTGVVRVVAGVGHTCALKADGTVHCWGARGSGQLGVSPNTLFPAGHPLQALNLDNAVALAAGAFHTCAVVVGGTVKCWGLNDQGQIGNSQTGGNVEVPTLVSTARLSDAVAVTAGAFHTCARRADDTVRCWGDNSVGQLGNSVNTDEDEPVPVVGIDPVPSGRGIAAGSAHTCAARANGNAACWGDNSRGQLGNGDANLADQPSPVTVRGPIDGVLAVAGSSFHTCALRFDGTVRCWGDNASGQLGNPNAGSFSTSPVPVSALTGAVAVAGGSVHTCALRVDGRVSCWGGNASGQLGDGSGSTPPRLPVTVIKAEGGDLLEVVAIAAGANHTCALQASGSVRCWGGNGFGELGDATTVPISSRAVTVVSLPDATTLAAVSEANHTCALRADGSVRCWGRNDGGQLGDGTAINHNFPVPVNGVTDAVAIAGGFFHSCAVRVRSLMACWGQNGQGQLGDGTRMTLDPPVPVTVLVALVSPPNQSPIPFPLTGGVVLAAGRTHTCALLVNGQVGCWGDNDQGQLGNGGAPTDRLVATAVSSFTFNVEQAVALDSRRRVAEVTALASCEAGAHVQIHVVLNQGAVSGHGLTAGRCTGALERYEVTVRTQKPGGFVPGPATAAADAIVRNRGQVVDQPHWTRAVELVVAP